MSLVPVLRVIASAVGAVILLALAVGFLIGLSVVAEDFMGLVGG